MFLLLFFCFFFFKQKTAYEMRISDWSSDVCSSDLFVREVKVIDGNAAIIEQGPLHEALAQDLHEKVDVALGCAGADGDMMQAGDMVRIHDHSPRSKYSPKIAPLLFAWRRGAGPPLK